MKKILNKLITPKNENTYKNFYFPILIIFILIFINYIANGDFMKCSICNYDIQTLDTQREFPPYLQ